MRQSLQASVRKLAINVKSLAPTIQSRCNSTLAKQTSQGTDIAFLTACVYVCGGGVRANSGYRNLLGRLVMASFISSFQSILVKNILETSFGFRAVKVRGVRSK